MGEGGGENGGLMGGMGGNWGRGEVERGVGMGFKGEV